ncbi:anaerobic ribonucleoside-triphosphate reductase activating protein [Vibrio chagasii]|nr:anaerobic ribonucleoside-triphosphate reductase activating protein [Vibrio chagasii]
MNYAQYYDVDVVNGEGTRCTLFVSGCEFACKSCYNAKAQNFNHGALFTQEMEDRILSDLLDTRIKRRGLSILGGEPLHPRNLSAIKKLVDRVKAESPNSSIWVWTGFEYKNLSQEQLEVVSKVDVLIDGLFVDQLKDPALLWRGSSNQIIHRFDLN